MTTPAKRSSVAPRLFFIVAREARTAVVLRKGPTRHVHLLRWDLATDVVTPGQWLVGRVYNEKCDLSPDGQLLVYFAGKFKKAMGTFTAVCRPPYFTALALWPDSGTWGGGGFFATDHELILNYGYVIPELNEGRYIPPDFAVVSRAEYQARNPNAETLAQNNGWREVAEVSDSHQTHHKAHPTRPRVVLERSYIGSSSSSGYRYRLIETAKGGEPQRIEPLGRLDWAEWDHDGSLLMAENGRLLRRPPLVSLRGTPAETVEVADLRGHVFRSVLPADHAREWP